ncbi:MAG: isopentenyl-diphosphate Delta-isomerase [Bacteroidota bacterium]
MDEVILVDKEDNFLGTMEKLEAHQKGLLHRAFSIYLINEKGDFLLQRRAQDKYHSAGLWTNTCCSHPQPEETTTKAAIRRLNEEMGINSTPLTPLFHFVYKADFGNGLTEHELDHVFIGTFNGEPLPDPNEVMEWKYIPANDLLIDVKENPQNYTEWFKLSYETVLIHTSNQ